MPTSADAFCLPATYTADPGSSPTRIVASPGRSPNCSANCSTSCATVLRTSAAIALPSMICAAMRSTLSELGDRRVLRHELALAAVAGKAYDDDSAGFDRGHDA